MAQLSFPLSTEPSSVRIYIYYGSSNRSYKIYTFILREIQYFCCCYNRVLGNMEDQSRKEPAATGAYIDVRSEEVRSPAISSNNRGSELHSRGRSERYLESVRQVSYNFFLLRSFLFVIVYVP